MEQQTSSSHVPSPSVRHPKFEVHRDKKRRYSIPGPNFEVLAVHHFSASF